MLLDEALFDRVIQWAAAEVGEAEVRSARERFEQLTGPIEVGESDFESRMAHFFERWLCDEESGESLLVRYVKRVQPVEGAARQLAALQRSHRSLWRFDGFMDGAGRLQDVLLGGRYWFQPGPCDRELREGDRFDGRLLGGPSELWLSPGRVYHPRLAHDALDKLLVATTVRALPKEQLLDALLGMRSRLLRFESIRPEHVYSVDGLSESAFAAPWARPSRRVQRVP